MFKKTFADSFADVMEDRRSWLLTAGLRRIASPFFVLGVILWGATTAQALTPQGAVTITSAATGTYGNAYTATATGGNGTGAIVWALGSGSTASGAAINASTGAVTATSIGTVRIKAYRAGDSTYAQSATTADFTITLAPRSITVTLAGSKNYDGTTTPSGASASITSGSLVGSDTISYAFSNTPSASVGSYSAQAGGGIAFRSSSHNGGLGGPVILSKPTGTAVNDVLLVCVSTDSYPPGNFTAPTGWTSLGTAGNGYDGQLSECFIRVVDGSEGSTFTFSFGGSDVTGLILCYSGVNPTTPLNVAAAIGTNDGAISSGGTLSSPSLTPSTNGCMTVWLAGLDPDSWAAATFTPPTGYTLRETSDYGYSKEAAADATKSTAGATGTLSGSVAFSGGAGTFGFTVALAPAAGGTSLVTATLSNASSYIVTYAGAYTITSLSTQGAVSITSGATGTYGTTYTATATGGNGTGAIVWALGSGSTASGAAINASTGVISANSSGTVQIKAYRAGDSTYAQSATTADFTVTLSPRPITVTLTGSKNYDGSTTPSGASASITSGSLAGSDTISYAFGNTSSANAGSYSGLTTATVANASAPTTRTTSYAITYAGAYTINSVTLTPQGAVTISSASTGTYGNAYTATATGGNGTGAIVWALGSGSTASGAAINASSGAVTTTSIGTVKIKAYRAGDSTYAQSATTADFTITLSPRPITVTLAGSKNYDGTTTPSGASASITSGSLVGSDTISYAFSNTPSASVGSYSAQAGGGIAFRSSSSGGDYSGTVALAKPTGAAVNDVLLACMSYDNNSAVTTPPTGWTSLGAAYNYYDGQTSEVFLHVVDGSESGTFNFGYSGGTAAGLILCYSGVNPATPLNVPAVYATNDSAISSGGTVTAPSVTTTTNGTMLVWLAGLDGDGNSGAATFTAPSGYALRQTSNYSWNYESSADRLQATAGATGTVSGSAVFPGGAGTFGFTVALAPAGGISLVTATISNPSSYIVTYAGAYTINNATGPVITSVTTASGQVGTAFSYQITANNTPTSFGATGLPPGLSVNTSTGLISGTPTAAGTNSVTVSATNASGTGSATLNLTIATSSTAVVAINAGGPAVGSFAADNYFTGGNVYSLTPVIDTSGVTNPAPASVYQSERWGNCTYTLPGLTANATYKVRLHFAEFKFTAPNQRQFNVSINGQSVLTNFDIFAAAGALNRAVVREFNTTANVSGQIAIQFSIGAFDEAKISGIEVVASSGPVITSSSTATGQVGTAFSYQITASNTPTSFSATGLPPGLSVNTSTGLISGTPTAAGTNSVTVSATNASGTGSATLNLTIATSSSAVLAINAGGSAVGSFAADNYFNAGTVVVYPGTAVIDTSGVSNPPPAAVYQSVRWGDLTYTLPGLTPGASYKVRLHFAELYFTAANQRQFNVAINGSSVLTNFDIVATAGGMNRAVVQEFNATANASGQILVQFSTGAYNYADISAIEVITNSATAPVISSATTASGQVGTGFSYQITASNTPTSFNATGLPAGLSVNTTTGLISGTPTATGTSSVTLNATNASGTGSAILNLTVTSAANTAPTITTVSNQTTTAGVAVGPLSFTVGDAQTAAASLTVSGASSNTALVPNANLVFGGSGASRTVTVTPVAGQTGTATVTLTVSDGSLTTSSSFILTVNATAPGISSPSTATGQTGAAFSYQIIASGNPTSYSATGLPPGLSINTSTGLISGTPTTLGSTSVTISATNSGGTVSSTITITILATLPYTTDFESGQGYTLASLQGQQGWTVSSGTASVTNSDHSNGTQSVQLSASNPVAAISQGFGPSSGNAIEYFDFFAKPVAQASLGSSATFTVEGAKFALQLSGSQGLLRVFSGNGSGGGTWTSTAFLTALTTGNVTAAWTRFTARLDFAHHTWDLYANGTMVAADIPFTTNGSTYLSVFQMLGDVTTASRLDYIYAGPTNPVFADTNNNGIDDNWETVHGFSLGADNRNTSPTGNGVTVIQAYVNGTNPNDYFNGTAPTLTIVSGNNQTAPAGQFNAQPFDIGVWNAAGTAPLVNAPVTFTLQGTDLLLARTNTSNPQLYNSVTLYSDADGTVQAYFKQPVLVGVQSQINVTAGSRQLTLQTISAAIGGADTDGNGLADSWERQYFGHIGVDPNADPDSDGISNIVEFQLGTNPLSTNTNTTNSNLPSLKVHRPN